MSQRLIEDISKNTGYLRSTHLYHPRRDAIRARGFSSMRFSKNLPYVKFSESKRALVISLNIHVTVSVSFIETSIEIIGCLVSLGKNYQQISCHPCKML